MQYQRRVCLAHSRPPSPVAPALVGHTLVQAGPTLSMFVYLSKSVLPTPKFPSTDMGFLLEAQ